MALRWPYKLIADLRFGVRELYDLESDPDERRNLADRAPDVVAARVDDLRGWIDALGESNAARSALARGRIGDRSAIPDLVALAEQRRERVTTRTDAIRVLATLDEPRVRSALAALLVDREASVVDAAAVALGTLGDDRARSALLDAVHRDDRPTRTAAALALARLGDGRGEDALRDDLASDEEDTRMAAVDALTHVADVDALEDLTGALDDEHLRYRAVLGLGALRSPESWSALMRIAERDRADDVRANAAAALALSHAPGAVEWLARRAFEGGAQTYAASALGALGAVGRSVDGWDARDPRGTGWIECHATGATPAWRLLGARSCRAEREATMPMTVRASASPIRLVVRARGEGTLSLATDHEIAQVALADADHEWRIDLAPDALSAGRLVLTARAAGAFEITHCLVLRADAR
jgi:hypothetical protein